MKKYFMGWLNALYPALFVLIVLFGIIWVFYGNISLKLTGNSQRSTFQKLDLLEFELSSAGSPKNTSNKTVVISLTTNDLANFEVQRAATTQNIVLSKHLEIAKKVLHLGAEHVYLHWFFPLDLTPAEILKIEKLDLDGSKVSIIASFNRADALRTSLKGRFEILVADFCNGKKHTVCPYNPNWDYLAVQKLSERYGKVSESSLSLNLPNPSPSYILKPLRDGTIPTFTYSDINTLPEKAVSDKIVFLGTDILQGTTGMTEPDEIGRVSSLYHSDEKILRANGTPIHEYLALSLENILSNGWINVVDRRIIQLVNGILPLLLLVLLFFSSIAFSMSFFIGSIVFIVLGNILTIRYFNLYFPDYDCLFMSALSLIGGGFIKYSIEHLKYSSAATNEKFLLSSLDIKYNFISLISHNLNTPVARIKVLTEGLSKLNQEHKRLFDEINYFLTDMQATIRAVLGSTRLEESQIALEPILGSKIEDDLKFDITAQLKRRKIEFIYEIDFDTPFCEDKKLLFTLISSVCFLAPVDSTVYFSITTNLECIQLEWVSTTRVPLWKELENISIQSSDCMVTFINQYIVKRKAKVTHQSENDSNTIIISVPLANLTQ
jgi:signal transduction histidine kinase